MLVGYARISTEYDGQTFDLQLDALAAAGVDRRHVYTDIRSGAKDDRAGLAKALTFCTQGDTLMVWKLDRLGRSLSHLLAIILDLEQRGIAFRSLTEEIDTTTPHGRLLLHIFGALAEFERGLIQERVKAGLAAAKIRGRHPGRPRQITQEKLAAIQQALANGMTKAAVCRAFGIKRTTLYDALDKVSVLT